MQYEGMAARIREEHKKVSELSDVLRKKAAVVPRVDVQPWIEDLRERFGNLRAHLIQHMAMEEEGGYLAPVIEIRPTLSRRVERLRHEHAELQRIMVSLGEQLEQVGPNDFLLARDCCYRLVNLLNYIEHHENDENSLLEYAFTQDVGAKD